MLQYNTGGWTGESRASQTLQSFIFISVSSSRTDEDGGAEASSPTRETGLGNTRSHQHVKHVLKGFDKTRLKVTR